MFLISLRRNDRSERNVCTSLIDALRIAQALSLENPDTVIDVCEVDLESETPNRHVFVPTSRDGGSHFMMITLGKELTTKMH
jgi:hypothetical protein